MRRIEKRKPGPPRLVELRRQGKHYANLDDDPSDKAQVRQALLEDQGYLCCYCMRSIHPEKHRVRVEHFHSQSSAPERDLDWDNLLAACSGAPNLRGRAKHDDADRRVPRDNQTCDNRKGDAAITINPLDKSIEAIRYLKDGRLQHPDPSLQEDLEQRLNLNTQFLVEARLSVRDELIARLRKHLGPDKTWTAKGLARYLDDRRRRDRLPPFFGLIEHDLARWIARRR